MKHFLDLLEIGIVWSLDHSRCEWLVISDTTLARFTASTGVFHGGRVVLLGLLLVPRELLSSTKLWILVLLEEFFFGCILVVYGALPTKLGLRLIHVVNLISRSVINRSCSSHCPVVVRDGAKFRLVHEVLGDVLNTPVVVFWPTQFLLVHIGEVVLLCGSHRTVLRDNVPSDGLVILEKLLSCGILTSHRLVLTIHGVFTLEELMLGTFSFVVVADVVAHHGRFSLLKDHVRSVHTPAHVTDIVSDSALCIKQLLLDGLLRIGVFDIVTISVSCAYDMLHGCGKTRPVYIVSFSLPGLLRVEKVLGSRLSLHFAFFENLTEGCLLLFEEMLSVTD